MLCQRHLRAQQSRPADNHWVASSQEILGAGFHFVGVDDEKLWPDGIVDQLRACEDGCIYDVLYPLYHNRVLLAHLWEMDLRNRHFGIGLLPEKYWRRIISSRDCESSILSQLIDKSELQTATGWYALSSEQVDRFRSAMAIHLRIQCCFKDSSRPLTAAPGRRCPSYRDPICALLVANRILTLS